MNKLKGSKLSSNQQAIMRLAQLFAILVVVGVVGYSEIMFLQVISRAFPDGIFKIIAMIGGVSTGLSVLTLLLAKAYWFRPGNQTVAAWAFTGIEVIILLLNVLLSFALASGPLKASNLLSMWYTLCPSSPLFALVGWTVLMMLDRSQQERHDYLEMEDEMRASELEHQRSVHDARMKLRSNILHSHAAYLEQFTDSPDMQEDIKRAARMMATQELSSFIGQHVAAMRNGSPSNTTPLASTTDDLSELLTDMETPRGDYSYADGYALDASTGKHKVRFNRSDSTRDA